MSQAAEAVFQKDLGPDDIKITDAAGIKISELLSDADDEIEAVRIYVSGGGCGGMTYGMTYADAPSKFDKVKTAEGFKLYVDAVALGYLKGCEVDFVNDGVNSSFVFNNVFQSVGGSGGCNACGGASSGGCGA